MIIRVPEDAGTLYERILYPAGELQIRFLPSVLPTLFCTEKIVVICREAHKHLMELALLSDALHSLCREYCDTTLVLPYLPYSRADRRFQEGDCHGLHTFGRYLNDMMYNRILTLDVHSYRAQRNVHNLVDVSAKPFIAKAVADICDRGGHPVILLPDEGAKRYGLEGAHQATKKRDPATGKLSGFEVPDLPANHDVLIVDDICDGGGTFIGLAQAIHKGFYDKCNCEASGSGATPISLLDIDNHQGDCPIYEEGLRPKKLSLYVTHGIFSKGFSELLQYFNRIYTTDSIFGGLYSGQYLTVFNCMPTLLSELLKEPK